MALFQPPTSQSFSNARCRYPISTSALRITSPSSSVTIRMIPCMAGCCGPTPSCMGWVPPPVPAPSPSMNSRVVVGPEGATSITRLPRASRRGFALPSSDLGADQRLTAIDRIVLPERVADELLVEQQALQVRMAGEAHPEHVPHLALEPVGNGPEAAGRRHHRVVFRHTHLHAQTMVVRHREEVIDDLEARPVLAAGELRVVHRGQVRQHVEAERAVVTTVAQDVE